MFIHGRCVIARQVAGDASRGSWHIVSYQRGERGDFDSCHEMKDTLRMSGLQYIYSPLTDLAQNHSDHRRVNTMDKLTFTCVWILCYIALSTPFCGHLPMTRKCFCRDFQQVECMGSSLGRLPQMAKDIQSKVEILSLRANLINSLTDMDLVHYDSLRKLDLRLQRSCDCVYDARELEYPHLKVLGLCAKVGILLIFHSKYG